jgi:hypothetical protein
MWVEYGVLTRGAQYGLLEFVRSLVGQQGILAEVDPHTVTLDRAITK